MLIRTFFIIFHILSFSWIAAQNYFTTPYSRYGLGELFENNATRNAAMGGGGIASVSTFYWNTQNIASTARLKFTTAETGIYTQNLHLQSRISSNRLFNTGISGVQLALPANKIYCLSMGIKPFSRTGYQLEQRQPVDNANFSSLVRYEGKGGISEVFVGNAFQINKNISIGVQTGYLFGFITNNARIFFDDSVKAQYATVYRKTNYQGLMWSVGSIYDAKLNSRWQLRTGVSGTMPSTIVAKRNIIYDNASLIDTLITIQKSTVAPFKIAVGWELENIKGKTFVLDIQYQPWSQYDLGVNERFQDWIRISAGAEIIPDYGSIRSYFKRVSYRLGAFWQQNYFLPSQNEQAITTVGVTLGTGLPIKRNLSRGHFSAEIGLRGYFPQQNLKEIYAKCIFSITLSDKWFIRRKLD
ncbi:MAG: hypothetical protein NZ455_05785 [Bacteroidia bacterium]|nr:hypothetical protein [Bacteroidia bacterium]MDW8347779.1 hypothetical protein [Bacteroidia bacterium]